MTTVFPSNPNNYTVYNLGSIVTYQNQSSQYWIWSSDLGWQTASEEDIGSVVSEPNLVYDIIQTLVCNYGGESIDKIIINDVCEMISKLAGKQLLQEGQVNNIINKIFTEHKNGKMTSDNLYTVIDKLVTENLLSQQQGNSISDKVITALENGEMTPDDVYQIINKLAKKKLLSQHQADNISNKILTYLENGKIPAISAYDIIYALSNNELLSDNQQDYIFNKWLLLYSQGLIGITKTYFYNSEEYDASYPPLKWKDQEGNDRYTFGQFNNNVWNNQYGMRVNYNGVYYHVIKGSSGTKTYFAEDIYKYTTNQNLIDEFFEIAAVKSESSLILSSTPYDVYLYRLKDGVKFEDFVNKAKG